MSIDVARINQTLFNVEAAITRAIEKLEAKGEIIKGDLKDVKPTLTRVQEELVTFRVGLTDAIIAIHTDLEEIKEILKGNNG